MASTDLDRWIDQAHRALREGRVSDLRRSIGPAVDLVERTLAERPDAEPTADDALRVASLLQAAFRFGGERADFDRGLGICRTLADRVDEPSVAVRARATMATYYVLSGEFIAMVAACDAALELADAAEVGDHPVVGMAHQFRGYALYEWDRLEEASAALERAWQLAPADSRGIRSGTARMMAMVCLALGDDAASRSWTERLQEIVSEPMTLRNREWLDAVRALRHGRLRRDVRAADRWAHRYGYPTHAGAQPEQAEAASRLHEYDHLLTVLESTSQWEPMLHVSDAMALGARSARRWYAARAHAARAVGLEGLRRSDEADRAWVDALRAGRAEGYVRLYAYGAWPRDRLLDRATADPDVGAFAAHLRSTANGDTPTTSPLTPRQLEALGHVANGLSNRDIAEVMAVSETTVKTHLRSAYERLGVRSRTQAVAQARALGVL